MSWPSGLQPMPDFGCLRRIRKAAYYYHLTEQNFGPEWTPKPRNVGGYRSPDEPDTPRTCVAPSVEHCLSAIWGSYSKPVINIYRTRDKIRPHYPQFVVDSFLTREKWCLESYLFDWVGSISLDHLCNFMSYIPEPIEFFSTMADRDQQIAFRYLAEYVRMHVKIAPISFPLMQAI